MLIKENEPLAPFTTFGIGGPARWFVEAQSEDDVVEATGWARERDLPLFVLGGGSNLLVADAGFDGLVMRIGLKGISAYRGENPRSEPGDPWGYSVRAGEDWDAFVSLAVADGCAGIECLAGIPGTVGGTPVQNVGAYGQEVSSTIGSVRALDLQEGIFRLFTGAECGFMYRKSRFNTVDRGRYVVTEVSFGLWPGRAPTLRYPELERALAESRPEGGDPSLVEVAAAVRRIRRSKGMLLVEGDADCRSAGSFFKNPVIDEDQYRRIAAGSEKEPPRFPAGAGPEDKGRMKVPAAWLIEQSGFARGYSEGAVGISSRHTLALVNLGGASAAQILAFAGKIAATVEERFGIRLEMEPVLLGF
jgi:UDP-N-acetylmuramate dehydrogenase